MADEDDSMLRKMLSRALQYYREQLKETSNAIDYLKKRGVSGNTARMYGLGYAPSKGKGLRDIFTNYQVPALVECGLVIEGEKKRYDRFRDRIMFPILDDTGQVVGFGGRVMDSSLPKYLNSPETALFNKGEMLFGLPQAIAAIQSSGMVLVVEGYMDVVMLAEHGILNSVASLGTATTMAHVQKLKAIAQKIVFCFDDDAAGQRAMQRAMDLFTDQIDGTIQVLFLCLPNGHDPDSYVREHSAEALLKLADNAIPYDSFMVDHLMINHDLETVEGRAHFIHDAFPYLVRLKGAMQIRMIKRISCLGKLTEEEMTYLVYQHRRSQQCTRHTSARTKSECARPNAVA